MHSTPLQMHLPEEIQRQLADRVRAERLRLRWKQATLAERSGVSLPTLRRFERTAQGSLETFLRLCHALGRLDELAGLLAPPPATTMAELEARDAATHGPKRGTR